MTHEGRLTRGEENFKAGLLDNEDTKYFLENKPAEETPKKKGRPKKEKD